MTLQGKAYQKCFGHAVMVLSLNACVNRKPNQKPRGILVTTVIRIVSDYLEGII